MKISFLFCICIHFSLVQLMFSLQTFDPYINFSQLTLPPGPFGPDSAFLNENNQGPYVGVSDGRIMMYNGTDFVDFAYLSPNRTKKLCDGVTDPSLRRTCGRPLGLTYDSSTGFIYAVGAYGGFYRIGREGGLATLLASEPINGPPFNFLTGIDLDAKNKAIYFSDTSLIFTFDDAIVGKLVAPNDTTGRIIKYDIAKNVAEAVLQNMPGPVGPAVSPDSSFVVYSSGNKRQVFKYSLTGTKAGTTELLFGGLPGYPLKIKRAPRMLLELKPSFWVAVNVVIQEIPPIINPYGYKFNSDGKVILIKNFTAQYPISQVYVVQEYRRGLFCSELIVGSRVVNFVGRYRTC